MKRLLLNISDFLYKCTIRVVVELSVAKLLLAILPGVLAETRLSWRGRKWGGRSASIKTTIYTPLGHHERWSA